MNTTVAPAQLSIAPRPLPDEVLSSWLLRTAAANATSLAELLDGLHLHYPDAQIYGGMLDYSIPEVTLRALSHFTRVPLSKLCKLDLSVRIPHLNSGMLLRFRGSRELSQGCPRRCSQRVGYAFCPQCLTQQKRLHIRWDWCIAAFIRCSVHRSSLLDSCPHCGDVDSSSFSPIDERSPLLCRSCFGDLTTCSETHDRLPGDDSIIAIETAYRSALVETASHPTLINNFTGRAVRRFVEDMLQTFVTILSSHATEPSSLDALLIPRASLLTIVAELVQTATPVSDSKHRNARYRRSLVLWSTLFQVMSELQGKELERRAQYWPVPLQRRFLCGLADRRRKRWPYNPYSSAKLGLTFKCHTLVAVLNLRASSRSHVSKSRI